MGESRAEEPAPDVHSGRASTLKIPVDTLHPCQSTFFFGGTDSFRSGACWKGCYPCWRGRGRQARTACEGLTGGRGRGKCGVGGWFFLCILGISLIAGAWKDCLECEGESQGRQCGGILPEGRRSLRVKETTENFVGGFVCIRARSVWRGAKGKYGAQLGLSGKETIRNRIIIREACHKIHQLFYNLHCLRCLIWAPEGPLSCYWFGVHLVFWTRVKCIIRYCAAELCVCSTGGSPQLCIPSKLVDLVV